MYGSCRETIKEKRKSENMANAKRSVKVKNGKVKAIATNCQWAE